MKNLAIYGAGGLGKELTYLIRRINETQQEPQWNLIGFFDDGKPIGTQVSHFGQVLGGIDELNSWDKPLAIALAVGKPQTIKSIRQKITNVLIEYPNLIDPTFELGDSVTFNIGEGNIIQGDCFASCDVKIGSFNLFNGSDVIGHDTIIGDYNVIMPNIRISGEVSIGNCNLFGVGSIIIQQLKIGNGVQLSPGSVLLTKPKDNCLYIGNPAKLFKY